MGQALDLERLIYVIFTTTYYVSPPFCIWGNWKTERLSNLLKSTQLVSGGGGIWTMQVSLQSQDL